MAKDSHETVLQAVFETAVDGVILIDAAGNVVMFNPACEKLFGYTADEVIGHNVKLLMPTPFHEEHDRYLENYHATGRRKIIGIGREVLGRRKDGSTFPMDLSVGETKRDGRAMFVGIVRDLTERERSAKALLESAAQLRAVVNTAVDGVILIDAKGTIIAFNPACEKLFGYTADEVLGQNVKLLMPPPFHAEHDGYINNYHRTHTAKIIGIGREVVGQRKDGTTFPMNLSVGEAEQEGGSIYVGIIHDLTDRKNTERQLIQAQKMEAVGQLSGGIAHDFNNLLTVIVGNADLMTDKLKARPDLLRQAVAIRAAGQRGAVLTQRLLAFSRRQTLQPAPIDCNELISSMLHMLQRTLRDDIEIVTTLAPNIGFAFADPTQLESAILNLSINARDAMPHGGQLTIATAVMPLDEDYRVRNPEVIPGNYVMVSITDDGSGMPKDVLEHVFEPFFTTKEVGKGSGLGLSMVYGFIKQSNGHVSIYSEPGLGTTVRLYLPAAAKDKAEELAPAVAESRNVRGRECILVAEDDPFVRAYAVDCLADLGYRVVSAADGHEALAKLRDHPEVQVLFTDVVMPGGLSGFDLAEKARKERPDIKLLFTSGYALDTLVARGKADPSWTMLNKPYRKQDLAERLRDMLDAS
jgi:PAS domain S-box-containing protein